MIFLLSACSPKSLEFSAEVVACENIDFSEEEESEIEWDTDGDDLLIYRSNVERNCDSVFVPEYQMDGRIVYIREYWESEDPSCSICYEPTIRIKDAATERLEFWWYIGEGNHAYGLVQVNQ